MTSMFLTSLALAPFQGSYAAEIVGQLIGVADEDKIAIWDASKERRLESSQCLLLAESRHSTKQKPRRSGVCSSQQSLRQPLSTNSIFLMPLYRESWFDAVVMYASIGLARTTVPERSEFAPT